MLGLSSRNSIAAMILTYRYRLLPTKRQHRALEAILESQRQLYNAALEERIDAYRKAGVGRTYFAQTQGLTEWRAQDPEATTLPANLQRATLKRLDEAYKAFFRRVKVGGKPGFPRFRGKGWFDSFGFREFSGVTFREGQLRFKGMPGSLRVHQHRPMPPAGVVKTCTVRRDAKGWAVAFNVNHPTPTLREPVRAVGLDLGISIFAVLSDGGVIPSLRARSTLAKDVRDASWARFISMLAYKAERAGVRLVEVDPRYTSQDCSSCGTRVPKDLDERQHRCLHCGLSIDRDLNAARNIPNRAGVGPGSRNAAGCGMRAGGKLGQPNHTYRLVLE
jgi:transposase